MIYLCFGSLAGAALLITYYIKEVVQVSTLMIDTIFIIDVSQTQNISQVNEFFIVREFINYPYNTSN